LKQVNPKHAWREWLIVPAYQQAMEGNYTLVKELQEVEGKYYRIKPKEFFNAGVVCRTIAVLHIFKSTLIARRNLTYRR